MNSNIVLTNVKLKDIKIDSNNPNIMTKEQMNGLKESMEKWGYLSPIIIDQNKKIIDGEHRFEVLLESYNGETKIDVIKVIAPDEQERRLIRQTMNKLRGQHDLIRDIREIEMIMSKDKHRETISRILQVNRDTVNKMKEKQNTMERNTRIPERDLRLTFYLDHNDHELVTRTLDKISLNKNEALVGLCNDWNEFQKEKSKRRIDKKILKMAMTKT
jgi:ParB-like chromosome segregation protein Spo0J